MERKNIHIIIPWRRSHLKDQIINDYSKYDNVIIHPVMNLKEQEKSKFPSTNHIKPVIYPTFPDYPIYNVVSRKVSFFKNAIDINDSDYYWVMCDDDKVGDGVIQKITDADDPVIFISMKRGHHIPPAEKEVSQHPTYTLYAHQDNVRVSGIGYEQMIMRGDVFKQVKYNDTDLFDDGKVAMWIKNNYKIRYEPFVYVLMNYYEPGRWDKDKEQVITNNGNKKYRLVIATPFYEMKGWTNYIASLAQTLLVLPRVIDADVDYWSLPGDSYIERARNTITNKFMRSDYTHLLFVDSDMRWDVEGILRLIAADVPLVGAGFPCKNNWEFYGCRLHCNDNGTPIVNSKGLISSWNVPTGFCLISKKVFEEMSRYYNDQSYFYQAPDDPEPLPYYDFFGHYFRKGNDYRDDVYFCRKWAEMGGEVWVEPRVTLGHAGYKEYSGNYHEFLMSCPKPTR